MDKDLEKIGQTDMSLVFTDEEKYTIGARLLKDLEPVVDEFNSWEEEFYFDMEIRINKKQPVTVKQLRHLMKMKEKFI